ncbi:MAG TPA: MaoC/PaaZ C-terminal domain-containing protein [Baekduia sp.]|nr:MaoC/PaaZ C-terminal domain-containing protein [Baekduia sp.]
MAVRTLPSAPGSLTLYRRAVTGSFALPLLRRVPVVGAGAARALPDVQYELPGVELDAAHVAAYARVCGFAVRDELPATYLHVRAFPLAMRLMTDARFPFGVIGLVHVANRIDQRRPVRLGDRPTVRVRAEALRDHERGRQFDVVAEALLDGDVVWEDRSTYLRRGGGDGGGDRAARASADRPDAPAAEAIWPAPGDIGRRYGAVSGDRNPIHLHDLSAKAFGQPGAIAHGMWLKARCLAALAPELPPAFVIDVRFKRPVLLPARMAFSSRAEDGGRAFALHDARRGLPHLEGRIAS